jgi:DNA repair exonuclease SbcCD ATPase subunit
MSYKFNTLLVLSSLLLLLFSCNNDELENKISELQQDSIAAMNQLNSKEEEILTYISSLNEIQENLTQIKEKEKIMTTRFDNGNEITPTMKQQIIEDINLINELLQENKDKMAALSSRLKKSNLKIAELEKMIEMLATQVQEKDAQIAQLQTKLAEANEQIRVLFEEYNFRLEELSEKEELLNTAYYCYGTAKELLDNGVITKEGGFIGIGKSKKLADDFNKKYFTQVDISTFYELDLAASKAKLVTTHPSDAYEIKGEKTADKLIIKNPEAFWSASKYLVIIVD